MVASSLKAEFPTRAIFKTWQMELLFAAPIVALVTYLFYSWFGVLNRYLIFLYFHRMGPGFDTTPFGWVTASRYWMSGLVAGGAVMIPYVAANFVSGRLVKAYHAPVWWRVWVLCAVPLAILIPAIVMTAGNPALPLRQAVQVTVVALAGLALAVGLGQAAASQPVGTLLRLSADAFGLACLFMALRAAEWFPRWAAQGSMGTIYRFLAVLAVGVAVIAVMTFVYYIWRRAAIPDAGLWFVAGANLHYLFLPIYHHLFWSTDQGSWTDPGYFGYIPDADNYFTRSAPLQIGIWIAVALVVLGVTRLRLWLRQRQGKAHSD